MRLVSRTVFALVALVLVSIASSQPAPCPGPDEQVYTKRLNAIRYADQFPGGTAGLKIANALNDLPSTGGVVDARSLAGVQTIDVNLYVGQPGAKPTVLLLGPTVFNVSKTITLFTNSSIVGLPTANTVGEFTPTKATQLVAAGGSNLEAVVRIGNASQSALPSGAPQGPGAYAVLQDLVIDGNGVHFQPALPPGRNPDGTPVVGTDNLGTRLGGAGVLVDSSYRVSMFRVTVQGSNGDGIRVLSTGSGNAGVAKFSQLMILHNRDNGLRVQATNDVSVEQSDFEGNGNYGVLLDNAAAFRITNSDLSNNLIGLYASGSSGENSIIGNQLRDNWSNDIALDPLSTSNIIADNVFSSGSRRDAYGDAIHVNGGGGNVISGNRIRTFDASHRPFAGIHIFEAGFTGTANVVTGNLIQGPVFNSAIAVTRSGLAPNQAGNVVIP